MVFEPPTIDREGVMACVLELQEEQNALEAQVAESIAALEAYQTHLDNWQRELVAERQAVEAERAKLKETEERIKHLQENFQQSDQRAAALSAELGETRDQIAKRTSELHGRAEEVRTLDGRCTELAGKLEQSQAREQELLAAMEQLKQSAAQPGGGGAGNDVSRELKELREMMEQQTKGQSIFRSDTHIDPAWTSKPAAQPAERWAEPVAVAAATGSNEHDPVIGSIVAQFDKILKQQGRGRATSKAN